MDRLRVAQELRRVANALADAAERVSAKDYVFRDVDRGDLVEVLKAAGVPGGQGPHHLADALATAVFDELAIAKCEVCAQAIPVRDVLAYRLEANLDPGTTEVPSTCADCAERAASETATVARLESTVDLARTELKAALDGGEQFELQGKLLKIAQAHGYREGEHGRTFSFEALDESLPGAGARSGQRLVVKEASGMIAALWELEAPRG